MSSTEVTHNPHDTALTNQFSRVGRANRGSKPGEKRGGRKKGVPNKFTGSVKEMILNALDSVGGQQYLESQAHSNPTAFMALIAKVLPSELNANHNFENPVTVKFEIVPVRPANDRD